MNELEWIDKLKKKLEQDRSFNHREINKIDAMDMNTKVHHLTKLNSHCARLHLILEYIALIEDLENEGGITPLRRVAEINIIHEGDK